MPTSVTPSDGASFNLVGQNGNGGNDGGVRIEPGQGPISADQQEQKEIWNAFACHKGLTTTGPIVHYNKEGKAWWCTVLAESSILSTNSRIFYFEMKVAKVKLCVGIGIATKAMPLDGLVGWYSGDSYGYASNGTFWIGGFCEDGKAAFYAGDIVGCGIDLTTRQIIFTKNGQRLDTTDLSLSPSSTGPLFPCVTLGDSGDKIEANFGPDFKFDVRTL